MFWKKKMPKSPSASPSIIAPDAVPSPTPSPNVDHSIVTDGERHLDVISNAGETVVSEGSVVPIDSLPVVGVLSDIVDISVSSPIQQLEHEIIDSIPSKVESNSDSSSLVNVLPFHAVNVSLQSVSTLPDSYDSLHPPLSGSTETARTADVSLTATKSLSSSEAEEKLNVPVIEGVNSVNILSSSLEIVPENNFSGSVDGIVGGDLSKSVKIDPEAVEQKIVSTARRSVSPSRYGLIDDLDKLDSFIASERLLIQKEFNKIHSILDSINTSSTDSVRDRGGHSEFMKDSSVLSAGVDFDTRAVDESVSLPSSEVVFSATIPQSSSVPQEELTSQKLFDMVYDKVSSSVVKEFLQGAVRIGTPNYQSPTKQSVSRVRDRVEIEEFDASEHPRWNSANSRESMRSPESEYMRLLSHPAPHHGNCSNYRESSPRLDISVDRLPRSASRSKSRPRVTHKVVELSPARRQQYEAQLAALRKYDEEVAVASQPSTPVDVPSSEVVLVLPTVKDAENVSVVSSNVSFRMDSGTGPAVPMDDGSISSREHNSPPSRRLVARSTYRPAPLSPALPSGVTVPRRLVEENKKLKKEKEEILDVIRKHKLLSMRSNGGSVTKLGHSIPTMVLQDLHSSALAISSKNLPLASNGNTSKKTIVADSSVENGDIGEYSTLLQGLRESLREKEVEKRGGSVGSSKVGVNSVVTTDSMLSNGTRIRGSILFNSVLSPSKTALPVSQVQVRPSGESARSIQEPQKNVIYPFSSPRLKSRTSSNVTTESVVDVLSETARSAASSEPDMKKSPGSIHAFSNRVVVKPISSSSSSAAAAAAKASPQGEGKPVTVDNADPSVSESSESTITGTTSTITTPTGIVDAMRDKIAVVSNVCFVPSVSESNLSNTPRVSVSLCSSNSSVTTANNNNKSRRLAEPYGHHAPVPTLSSTAEIQCDNAAVIDDVSYSNISTTRSSRVESSSVVLSQESSVAENEDSHRPRSRRLLDTERSALKRKLLLQRLKGLNKSRSSHFDGTLGLRHNYLTTLRPRRLRSQSPPHGAINPQNLNEFDSNFFPSASSVPRDAEFHHWNSAFNPGGSGLLPYRSPHVAPYIHQKNYSLRARSSEAALPNGASLQSNTAVATHETETMEVAPGNLILRNLDHSVHHAVDIISPSSSQRRQQDGVPEFGNFGVSADGSLQVLPPAASPRANTHASVNDPNHPSNYVDPLDPKNFGSYRDPETGRPTNGRKSAPFRITLFSADLRSSDIGSYGGSVNRSNVKNRVPGAASITSKESSKDKEHSSGMKERLKLRTINRQITPKTRLTFFNNESKNLTLHRAGADKDSRRSSTTQKVYSISPRPEPLLSMLPNVSVEQLIRVEPVLQESLKRQSTRMQHAYTHGGSTSTSDEVTGDRKGRTLSFREDDSVSSDSSVEESVVAPELRVDCPLPRSPSQSPRHARPTSSGDSGEPFAFPASEHTEENLYIRDVNLPSSRLTSNDVAPNSTSNPNPLDDREIIRKISELSASLSDEMRAQIVAQLSSSHHS